MIQELEVVGLEMQAEERDASSAILAVVRDGHGNMSSRLLDMQTSLVAQGNSILSLLDNIGQASRDVDTGLRQAHSTTMSRLDTIASTASATQSTADRTTDQASRISDEIAAVRAEFKLLISRVGDIQQSNHDTMRHLSRLQVEGAGLSTLCNEIIGLLAGDVSTGSAQIRSWTARLTAEETNHVASGVRQKLLQCPSTLRDAHQNSRRTLQFLQECHCRPTSDAEGRQVWRFRFLYTSKSQHRRNCRFRAAGHRSWGYSMAVQLFPFLCQTVELTLGATAGMGRWSVAAPLRFYGTVRRAHSPLFRLFDELFRKCIKETRSYRQPVVSVYKRAEKPIFWKSVTLEWDLDETHQQLHRITRAIQEAITPRASSGTDLDEDGNSLFLVSHLTDIPVWTAAWLYPRTITEAAMLIFLARRYSIWPPYSENTGFESQLEGLFAIAIRSGSDPWHRVAIWNGKTPFYFAH
jgi:hypothetical protein